MFYGWIPTNKGKLEYAYISAPKEIKKYILQFSHKDNFFIHLSIDTLTDDFYNLRGIVKTNEIFVNKYVKVNIKRDFTGNIEILYDDMKNFSNFKIFQNGVINFFHFQSNEDNKNYDVIHQMMFNIVKLFVHGDIHHHQKIDISLPIMYDSFNPLKVATSMLGSIKLMESTVKKNNNCESNLKNKSFIYEMDGYIAYLDTFTMLFQSKNIKKQLSLAKNISHSLKSIISKREEKQKEKNYFFTILFTFIGFFISINILLNGFWFQNSNDLVIYLHGFPRSEFSVVFFLILLFCYFFYIKCKAHSYLYYKHYNMFEKLKFIKHAKKSDLNFIGNIIKALPLMIFIISLYSFQYYLMYIYKG